MTGFTRKKAKGGVGRVGVTVRERGWDLRKFSLGSWNFILLYIFLFVYMKKIIYNVILGTGEDHKFSTVYK